MATTAIDHGNIARPNHELVFQPAQTSNPLVLDSIELSELRNMAIEMLTTVKTGDYPSSIPEVVKPFVDAAARELGQSPALNTVDWSFTTLKLLPTVVAPITIVILGGYGGLAGALCDSLSNTHHEVILVDSTRIRELDIERKAVISGLVSRRNVNAVSDVTAAANFLKRHRLKDVVVVHCAGTLRLRKTSQITNEDIDLALREKSSLLNRVVSEFGERISRVCLFGSTESRHAHSRFGLYSLANSALRHKAASVAAQGIPTVLAEWSLWQDVGMAATSAGIAARSGHAVVSRDWGIDATLRLLFGELPMYSEWALGGAGPTTSTPVQGITGIGGVCLSKDVTHREQLIRHVGTKDADVSSLDITKDRVLCIVKHGDNRLSKVER